MLLIAISQTALADPIKKCVINGKTVYSDNICKDTGIVIDTTPASIPTAADKRAAELRLLNEKKKVEQKEYEEAQARKQNSKCQALSRDAEYNLAMSHKFPKELHWKLKAQQLLNRIDQECPNKLVAKPL